VTKEEVIAEIRKLTQKLGHVPTLRELLRGKKVTRHALRRNFRTYREALAACGLERRGSYRLPVAELFEDWARIVRKLGRVPKSAEYNAHSQYSRSTLVDRFGGWTRVPAALLHYAREQKLGAKWNDALELTALHLQSNAGRCERSKRKRGSLAKPRILPDRPFYGHPILPTPMGMAPTNENGVIFLFGAEARNLGFMMLQIQTGFPDGEAFREVEPGRWQRVRIEFEFESRNFVAHRHDVKGCDMIVCWEHNWRQCPLEVVELRKVVSSPQSE